MHGICVCVRFPHVKVTFTSKQKQHQFGGLTTHNEKHTAKQIEQQFHNKIISNLNAFIK